MEFFIQYLFNGLVSGATYSLVSIGYAIPFYLKINNFAHGSTVVCGAFAGYILMKYLGLPIVITGAIVIALGIFIGVVIYYLVIKRVRKFKSWAVIVAGTLGVAIIIENLILIFFGYEQFSIRMLLHNVQIRTFLGIYYSIIQLIILMCSIIILVIVFLVINKTNLGLKFTTVTEDYDASYIMGISPERISFVAFILGCTLATFSGFLISFEYDLNYSSGYILLLIAYTATIIGGTKDLRKVTLVAYLIGIIEKIIGGYITTEYMHASVFVILIFFLLIKKEGLEKIYELREV